MVEIVMHDAKDEFGVSTRWGELVYIHRTVRDYMKSPRVWNKLLSLTTESTGNGFNVDLALLEANLWWMKKCYWVQGRVYTMEYITLRCKFSLPLQTRDHEHQEKSNEHYGFSAFMTGPASPISEYTSAHVTSLSILSPFPKSHAPTRKIADISEVKIAIPELLVSFW
jgi:hypothetical protein